MNTIALQSTVKRVLVEKRAGFDLEAQSLKKDLIESLHIDTIENIRVLNRYDVEDLSEEVFENAAKTIFSEANLDVVYYNELENINENDRVSILMVTHDPYSASYASRILFIKDGKIGKEIKKDGKSREEFYQEIIAELGRR